jgi:hypothetical protein
MDNVANVVKPLKCNGIYEAMRPSMGIIANGRGISCCKAQPDRVQDCCGLLKIYFVGGRHLK